MIDLLRWTGATARADEPVEARRSRNVISGAFLSVGVLIAFISLLVLPGWDVHHQGVIAVIGGVAFVAAIFQMVLARLVPVFSNHVTSVFAAAMIAAVQILAADPAAVACIGLLYVWVAILVALYYVPSAIAVHITVLIMAQILVIVWPDVPASVPQTVITAGTCVTVAVIVGMLTFDMREQVKTDPLTGLVNRRGLDPIFNAAIADAVRDREPLAVGILDLDAFKKLNDTQGHAHGDNALTTAAKAWRTCLRPGDTLARIGGDEFVVLLPHCDVDRARDVLSRLVEATSQTISCSAGATICVTQDPPATVLARADAALYRAKEAGGARVVIDSD